MYQTEGIMEKDKHIGLRIDSETHKKLKSLAEFDGHSMSSVIRQAIPQHEHKHTELKQSYPFSIFCHYL